MTENNLLTGDRFAVVTWGGSYVVADPQAPLVYGCPCVLQTDPGLWLKATVVTKHPMRAKVLRINTGSGTVRVRTRSSVARIVGEFVGTRWREQP
jgi:hypothetical protein